MVHLPKVAILFWIRKQKINKRGLAPIYCRVTNKGKRIAEFSTSCAIEIHNWCASTQTANCYTTNKVLQAIKSRIEQFVANSIFAGKDLTKNTFKDLINPPQKPIFTMLQLMEKFVVDAKTNPFRELKPKTIHYYNGCISNFSKYIVSKKCINMLPGEITNKFLLDYFENIDHNTIENSSRKNRILQFMQMVLDYAVANNYIENNHLQNIKMNKQKENVTKTYLTAEQRNDIKNCKTYTLTESKVADMFLFQCYTGFSYSDLMTFNTKEHLLILEQNLWIKKPRDKNGNIAELPVLPEVKEILQKYENAFPEMTNQVYNRYIKRVAKKTKIEQNLTSHCARKTFGNMLVNEYRISFETTAATMGHQNIATTQKYYAAVKNVRIAEEMLDLVA